MAAAGARAAPVRPIRAAWRDKQVHCVANAA
jgi:hypothetical protein